MPLAVSATTRSGRSDVGVDERHDVVGERVEQVARRVAARPAAPARAVAVEHGLGDAP